MNEKWKDSTKSNNYVNVQKMEKENNEPVSMFSLTLSTVSALVMAPPAILLIDSDTANWQLPNVSGQSRSRKRRALAKYKRFLKGKTVGSSCKWNGLLFHWDQ